jgi:hypothetical protein
MSKPPKNTPKIGERVTLRGRSKMGKLINISYQELINSYWANVLWDNNDGPLVCHLYELEKCN